MYFFNELIQNLLSTGHMPVRCAMWGRQRLRSCWRSPEPRGKARQLELSLNGLLQAAELEGWLCPEHRPSTKGKNGLFQAANQA